MPPQWETRSSTAYVQSSCKQGRREVLTKPADSCTSSIHFSMFCFRECKSWSSADAKRYARMEAMEEELCDEDGSLDSFSSSDDEMETTGMSTDEYEYLVDSEGVTSDQF